MPIRDGSFSYMADLVNQRLARASAENQERLDGLAAQKKQALDPDRWEFDPDNIVVIDGDTFYDRRIGRNIRVGAEDGFSLDTFETGLDKDGNPNNYYEQNPQRFDAHARAYALQAGLDRDEVTPETLYKAGQAQKQALQDRVEGMRGQGFRLTGQDAHGSRQMAVFDDPANFDYIYGMNAAYFSRFNPRQITSDPEAHGRLRQGDQRSVPQIVGEGLKNTLVEGIKIPINLAASGAMLAGRVPAIPGSPLGVFQGLNDAYAERYGVHMVDALVQASEGLDKWKETWKSDGRKWQDLMAANYKTYVQEPLYQKRYNEYKDKGRSDVVAGSLAWLSGVRDTTGRMLDNPATIADVSLESMIYFVGSGVFSRLATKNLQKQLTSAVKSQAPKEAIETLSKQLSKRGEWAAIGFTAVTEGVSNAVGSYGKVMNLSEEELLAESEAYKALRDQGMSHEDAQVEVASKAGALTLVTTGLLAGAANKFTGAGKIEAGLFRNINGLLSRGSKAGTDYLKSLPGLVAKPATAVAKTTKVAGKVSNPAIREGVEEIIQSGGGETVSQEAARAVTGVKKLRDPVASVEAASAGLLAGVATGATLGNTSNAVKATGRAALKAKEKLGTRADAKHEAVVRGQRRAVLPTKSEATGDSVGEQTQTRARSGVNHGHKQAERDLNRSKDAPKTAKERLLQMADEFDVITDPKQDAGSLTLDIEAARTFYDAHLKARAGQPKTKEDRRIDKYMEEAERAAAFDLNAMGRALVEGYKDADGNLVEPPSAEEVLNDPEMYDIVARAVSEANLKLPKDWGKGTEGRKALDRRLNAEYDILKAVDNLETVSEATLQRADELEKQAGVDAKTRNQRMKTARQVAAEKLGYGTKGKLGMKGFVREMTGVLRGTASPSKKRFQFKALMGQLDFFLGTQQNRLNKAQALVDVFQETGRVTAADEARINKLPGSKVHWIEPRADGTGGTPALLESMKEELGSMRRIQTEMSKLGNEFDAEIPVQEVDVSNNNEQPEKSNTEQSEPKAETAKVEAPKTTVQEAKEKAQSVFEKSGVGGTRQSENIEAALRARNENEQADAFRKEFDRLVDKAVAERQKKEQPTTREQARQAAQERIDSAPKQSELFNEQTDNTNQGRAEAEEATETSESAPAMSEEEQQQYDSSLEELANMQAALEQDQAEDAQSGQERAQSEEDAAAPAKPIFSEEDSVEDERVAWYEIGAIEEALEDMPDMRADQVMFSHLKMFQRWTELVLQNPETSVAEVLVQLKAIAEETFSEEGRVVPESSTDPEVSKTLQDAAKVLSDPSASIDAETTTTSDGQPGFLPRMISYRMRKLLGHESQRSAIVGLWKLANARRRARGDTELRSNAIVTKWLRDYNIAKADGAVNENEQKLSQEQRDKMQKAWRLYVADVEHGLAEKSLPRSVSAFLRPAKEKTRNLLHKFTPVFSILSDYGTRVKFFAATKMVGREKMGMTSIVSFVNHFEGILQEMAMRPVTEDNKNSPYYRDRAGAKLDGIFQPLREYAMHLLFESGKDTLHPNVAAAIALVAGEWASSTGTQSIFQKDDAINAKLGREEGEFVTPEIRALFEHGTLVSNVAQDLGWRILRQLNLADGNADGIDPLHLERMAVSLGLMALKGLEASGRVEMYSLPRATMAQYSRKPEHQDGSGDFNFVRLAIDPETGKESQRSRNLRTMYTMAGSALTKYFNLETNARGPHFEVPDIVSRIEGAYGRIPKRMKQALRHASSRVWRPIEDAFEEMENFSRNELLTMLGWVDPQLIPEMHKDERQAQESKNATIERELDHALDWKATTGDNPFYFAYKLIRSARIYIDSNTVNPQASKLHRFLFAQDTWAMDMPIGQEIKDPLRRKKIQMLKVAVLQGLGGDVDKQSLATSVAKFNDLADKQWFKDAISALQTEADSRTDDDRAAVSYAVRQGGENMHSLLALKSWAKYQQALKDKRQTGPRVLKVTLPLEIDGVTNGFAIGLLQTPHGEALYDMLEAVGVYTEDSLHKTFHDFIEDGNQDNYVQLVESTEAEFGDSVLNGSFNRLMREDYWEAFSLEREGASAEEDGQISKAGFQFQPVGREWPISEGYYYSLSKVELEQFLSILQGDQWKAMKFVPSEKGQTKERGRQEAIKKITYLLHHRAESAAHFRQVMRISPVKLDRNFAKDPLMTSAYGAGMAAIKRALGRRAVRAFTESLSDLETYAMEGDSFVDSKLAREAYADFRARVDLLIETGREANPLRLTDEQMDAWLVDKQTAYLKLWKDLSDAEINEFRKNFDFDRKNFSQTGGEDFITREIVDPVTEETQVRNVSLRELLSVEIQATLGESLTRGLEQKIGAFEEVREKLNQAMQFSNLIFEENFARLIDLEAKTTGQAVSNRRRKELLNDLIKQGLVPAVKTPLSEDQLDALEITKYGKVVLKNDIGTEERGRAYFRKPLPRISQADTGKLVKSGVGDSITSIIEVLDVDSDVGVSMLVNLIHSSDGASMADLLSGFDVLGVHDAIVGQPLDLVEAGQAANKSFFENQRDWNLGQEILDSLQRLMPLMNPGDQRLSAEAKARVMSNFVGQLQKGKHSPERVQDWFADFVETVQTNNEARADLFQRITGIHQFAFPGTEHSVEAGTEVEVQDVDIPTSLRNFIDASVAAQENYWSDWATQNSKLVRENILHEDGNPQKVIVELIKQHQPSAAALLDLVMQSLFHFDTVKDSGVSEEAIEHLRDVAAVIMPGLTNTDHRQIDVVVGDENTYNPMNTTITVDPRPEQFLERLMHELTHAANWHRLEAIKKNDPERFREMLDTTKQWIKDKKSATLESKSGKLRAMLEIMLEAEQLEEGDLDARLEALTASQDESYRKSLAEAYSRSRTLEDGDVRAVAEFTAWLNTSLNQNGSMAWSANLGAFRALSQSMESKSGRKVYYSGPRGVDHTQFQADEGLPLNSVTFMQVIEDLKLMDGLSPDEQEFYDGLITQLIIPAMEGIDQITLKMVHDPNAETPEGAVITDRESLEIHLQTAGNRITNPNMMSHQEAMLHELIHAIMGHAVNTNSTIQNKLEKFYQQVKDRVDADGAWQVFAPDRPTPEERALAEERYEYLFGVSTDIDGQARLAERHLHEFAAIGLTDPYFMEYLRNLQPERENHWEDGFLTGLINLVRNAIQWFLGTLDGSNKDMYTALSKLAGQVSAQNIKYKKVTDQMMDNTRLQRWLNLADAKVATAFLERRNRHLRAWADANSLSGPELTQAIKDQETQFGRLLEAARSAAASSVNSNFEEFRNALEDAASGIQKDHWLYQLLTEIMPWSSRNHNWIDVMRKSEKLVDMDRQQKIEHNRTALHHWMGLSVDGVRSRFTNRQREQISHVVLYTDLSALLEGSRPMTPRSILNLLRSPQQIDQRLQILDGQLTALLETAHPELLNLFKLHSDGLARLMVNSTSQGVALQTQNVHQMLEQWFYQNPTHRTTFDPELREQLREILEHRTTLKGLLEVPVETREATFDLMQEQMDRTDTQENGWVMLLNMHRTYKETALRNSFDGNPANMWKGYVYEVYDDDISVEIRPDTPRHEAEMRDQGYRKVSTLPIDPDGPDKPMAMWAANRGISTYSKAIMSLTDIASRGTNYFDIFFTEEDRNDRASWTAAQAHRAKRDRAVITERQVRMQARSGVPLEPGTRMVPIFNPETGQVVDYRYVMTRSTKRKVLKRRDFYDELMPRMIASVADRSNTKTINREAVEMLRDEYLANRLNDAVRFIRVGKNLPGIAGEMWKLLPEDTKQAAREAFGSDVLYMRDELVNLVMGFRKLTLANNKFLGPLAPAVRIAERIWQEIIQWERFRIAVLNPAVVIGNIISNVAVLLVHGVNSRYIIRHWKEAVIGMRKFQRQTRQRNELQAEIDALQAQGTNTDDRQAQLARLDYYLASNPVKSLVDHGLFTNIVEEFGVDEKSYRRKYSNMLLDAVGGMTGSQGLVRGAQEVFMTPGSNTGNIALAATQYGDFVGRYLKYKWDKEVKGVDEMTAVRTALDTFIYYNIPQNRYLQWANDNGFMMFTKFFFRIQPIIARLFSHNPVRALAIFGVQHTTDIQVMGDSVSNYAFMSGLPNKLNLNVWDHVINGDTFYPSSLKWLTFLFDE